MAVVWSKEPSRLDEEPPYYDPTEISDLDKEMFYDDPA